MLSADVFIRGADSSCPAFLQPFRGPSARARPWNNVTPEPLPRAFGSARRPAPAGLGRAGLGRAGLVQRGQGGGACCALDRTSGRRVGLLPSRLGGAGRAGPGPGCTWTRACSRGFGVRRRRIWAFPTLGGRAPPTLFSPLGVVVWLQQRRCSMRVLAGAVPRLFFCSSVFPRCPWTYAVERGPLARGALRRCAAVLRRAFAAVLCP
jgi:hypothetical protein